MFSSSFCSAAKFLLMLLTDGIGVTALMALTKWLMWLQIASSEGKASPRLMLAIDQRKGINLECFVDAVDSVDIGD